MLEETIATKHPLFDTYGAPSSVVSLGNTEQNNRFLPWASSRGPSGQGEQSGGDKARQVGGSPGTDLILGGVVSYLAALWIWGSVADAVG